MTYEETVDYLYHAAPMFSNIGAGAYKEGLATTLALDEHFGHPHRRFRTIHVAGTNGKGSVSSTLAAILQSAGLKVGLYTSPHLVDFRERIRVNGKMIPKRRVIDFVSSERRFFEPLSPSFFELTTALAFLYFAEKEVDVAVVEVGLGGRLDCTNIIQPDLSIITNISFDHQQFLGDTLEKIAAEKAGIIKSGVPVVVGETKSTLGGEANDVRQVFLRTFEDVNAQSSFVTRQPSIRFADEELLPNVESQLKGDYQRANMRTVICAVSELQKQDYYRPLLTAKANRKGLMHVVEMTGFQGRWQVLHERPTLVCDAGHNAAGITYVAGQLSRELARMTVQETGTMRIVFGMVGDKDYARAVQLLSALQGHVRFYVTQPSCARALDYKVLLSEFRRYGIEAHAYRSVGSATAAALSEASADDYVFVGGSCYVVADLLSDKLLNTLS